MTDQIFNRKLRGTGEEGQRKYEAMSPEQKERFDKKTGINQYAAPGTGEGFTISTGGNQVAPDEWNFHWAGVVTSSGPDRVALENFAIPLVSKNAAWEFQMYGLATNKGQTFYEQYKATGQHGDAPTVLRVEKKRP